MGFSRQEYRNWLLFPPPGDFPNPGVELESPALAGALCSGPSRVGCRLSGHENEVAQSCPTLSGPMDCSPPGSSIHGIPGKFPKVPGRRRGTRGFPADPEEDLESPSSTRLEALVPSRDSSRTHRRTPGLHTPTTQHHGIRSHHFMANRLGNNGNSDRLYFGELQNHCRW